MPFVVRLLRRDPVSAGHKSAVIIDFLAEARNRQITAKLDGTLRQFARSWRGNSGVTDGMLFEAADGKKEFGQGCFVGASGRYVRFRRVSGEEGHFQDGYGLL